MKFLLISKMKDAGLAMPAAVSRQLMEATVAWVNQKMKEGVCLEAYVIPGQNGSAAIVDYKTAEDMNRDFAEMPVGMFMENEVYPLAEWTSINDSIEALKRAEQMMPK